MRTFDNRTWPIVKIKGIYSLKIYVIAVLPCRGKTLYSRKPVIS